ncbi:MAG: glycosyltransferase [Deltaproteobacteria bacterium]|nr:glycosyltransferase [Deltaproteobacteria bacterium]
MNQTYDVVVGIPSYREAETIGFVTRTAAQGLSTYFPSKRCIIVNCDNNSPDGTREAFLAAEIPRNIERKYITTPEGVTGKGNNFWNLFNFCRDVEAGITIVIDADLRSITPEWIRYLGSPVEEGHDLVTPLYSRHQFDGTITNHLCYPLVFSLAGIDIRQPIGGDFAFSRKLCRFWLDQEWNDTIRHYGIDIFMSLSALFGDFKVCQTGLGVKIHNTSTPKLGQMFEEVIHTLFTTLHKHQSKWLQNNVPSARQTVIRTVALKGLDKMMEPEPLSVEDIVRLKDDCRREYDKYKDLVKQYLNTYAYQKTNHMYSMDYYDLDIMLWSHIVYSLFYLFDGAPEATRLDIINALKPLYFERTITFNYQTYRYAVSFAEKEVRDQAMAFLCQKPYLLGLYAGNGGASPP